MKWVKRRRKSRWSGPIFESGMIRKRGNVILRGISSGDESIENLRRGERISGKGDLTRKRTVSGELVGQESGGFQVELQIDPELCETGRVISVHGLNSVVDTGKQIYTCAIKGVLKALSTDLQHVVVAGDHVTIQPIDSETAVIVLWKTDTIN